MITLMFTLFLLEDNCILHPEAIQLKDFKKTLNFTNRKNFEKILAQSEIYGYRVGVVGITSKEYRRQRKFFKKRSIEELAQMTMINCARLVFLATLELIKREHYQPLANLTESDCAVYIFGDTITTTTVGALASQREKHPFVDVYFPKTENPL